VVCRSVCLSHYSEPCKNGSTDGDAVWIVNLWAWMGPKNQVLDGSLEVLRDVAMATNSGTKIAITGFVRTIATRRLVMEGGLSGRPTECRYCRYLAHSGRCHGNHFWLSVYGVHIGATWRIRLNRPCVAAVRPCVKLLWPLVIYSDWQLNFLSLPFSVGNWDWLRFGP